MYGNRGADSALRLLGSGVMLLGTTTPLTGGGRLQVNGAVNASQFYSEVITVTLPNNTTNFVNIKTFATTDKVLFTATAMPTSNVSGPFIGFFAKGYDGSTSVNFRTISIQQGTNLSWDSTTGNILRANAVGGTENQQIRVTIIYYNKI
jgi:hypothetical protein